jgi:uncharacterized phage protein (TIGR01671 family)
MRTIKFRAWDITHERMDEVWSVDTRLGLVETAKWKLSLSDPKDCELMQFTGLLDKNGKEIYEGDIVEWDDNSDGKWRRRCKFVYVLAHYRLDGYYYDISKPTIHHPIQFDCGAFAYEDQTEQELEVIGNIYENPELLS